MCCEIMEKIIRNAVLHHMICNQHLSDDQHGFIHGRSCTIQLITVVDKLSEILDNGEDVDMIYLDFAKAFDSVVSPTATVKTRKLCSVWRITEMDWRQILEKRCNKLENWMFADQHK